MAKYTPKGGVPSGLPPYRVAPRPVDFASTSCLYDLYLALERTKDELHSPESAPLVESIEDLMDAIWYPLTAAEKAALDARTP